MNFKIITLFPEMFEHIFSGVVDRARVKKIINIEAINPREFAENGSGRLDKKVYGGGAGMLLQAEPIAKAIEKAKEGCEKAKVIYVSPVGQQIKQEKIQSECRIDQDLIFLCGRYEGIDQRVIETYVDEQWSAGDFVLSGGEIAVALFIDAISRLKEGVVGKVDSIENESFNENLLEHDQYTKPEIWRGKKVPEVLLSGNHKNISHWQRKRALVRTWLYRPEMLEKAELSPEEQAYIKYLETHLN